jgi:hypothetical protein
MNVPTEPASTSPESLAPIKPTFAEAFRFWLKLGLISFGGPAGQIAIMQTELVEKKRWIGQARFLHVLNFCMFLPGPEAQQLAIYVGWLLHRTWGGIVAGSLFVVPSMFVLWALSFVVSLMRERAKSKDYYYDRFDLRRLPLVGVGRFTRREHQSDVLSYSLTAILYGTQFAPKPLASRPLPTPAAFSTIAK